MTDIDRAAEKDLVVELLGCEWANIEDLMAGLDDEQWSLPALPGWDVHDVLAHMIGTERSLAGATFPDVPTDLGTARPPARRLARRLPRRDRRATGQPAAAVG